MKRITTADVLAAYATTGLIPMRGEYFPADGCACGLGAIAAANGFVDGGWYDAERMETVYDVNYTWGFANGFDAEPIRQIVETDWHDGYVDGQAAWEAVKHLAVSVDAAGADDVSKVTV